MISITFDPAKPYRFVMYARMSSRVQNPRSPEQQFDTIRSQIRQRNLPWIEAGQPYRDDARSGRYIKSRPGLQKLLRETELKIVSTDLLIVDTLERLGRSEEIPSIRRNLQEKCGILVVTADSGFADPTGVTGKALALVENIRSTEDTRVKAHNVTRGKIDAVKMKRWPGGTPPFGFRLRKIVEGEGSHAAVYSVLEPIPDAIRCVQLLFERAVETGHGITRLARWWNECPEIPDEYKPMNMHTVSYILANQVYIGNYQWGAFNTDIVNDRRVIRHNPSGPSIVQIDYCPPVIQESLFRKVEELRQARNQQALATRTKDTQADCKLIQPLSRGLALTYLLSGLVRCGHCHSAMSAVSSSSTLPFQGATKTYSYTHYRCPRAMEGACDNRHYVREDRLRPAVIGRLRTRLFPLDGEAATPEWLPELFELIKSELHQRRDVNAEHLLETEGTELQKRLAGWLQTLATPNLEESLRLAINEKYAQTTRRLAEIQSQRERDRAVQANLDEVLNPALVLEALRHLDKVLAEYNPTAGNLELSRHIDRIECYQDGRVVLRGTRLGLFGDCTQLLNRTTPAEAMKTNGQSRYDPVNPRARPQRFIPSYQEESSRPTNQSELLDPERFAGLSKEYFWEENFRIDADPCWSEAHAEEVAEQRLQGKTHQQLAEHFGVTIPTIRKALKQAAQSNTRLKEWPRKMPRSRWQEEHYQEVAELRATGQSVAQLCKHFDVSEPLIRAALRIAADKASRSDEGHADESEPEDSIPGPNSSCGEVGS